jgi:hypothetical protein
MAGFLDRPERPSFGAKLALGDLVAGRPIRWWDVRRRTVSIARSEAFPESSDRRRSRSRDSPDAPGGLWRSETRWIRKIAGMGRYTRNNLIIEGFHTKMEMIQRRAYGFRNFENYRLRVRSLWGG